MKTSPITPARLAFNAAGLPYSAAYDDIYHPQAGAFTQAQHVFLAGNELPARWRQRTRFVVLETGFGLGNNFLATWQAWRDDPAHCQQLVFISIEREPLSAADMQRAHAHSPAAPLAAQLIAAWPPLTPNLHRLSFEQDQVQLLLALGDISDWLPELVAQVDAFDLDGFAPARNPAMWQPRVMKALARLAAPGATLATWSAATAVRDALRAAGFEVRHAPGTGGKRDITLARYAPAFAPRHAPSRSARAAPREQRALIIGAGLAGCATAWALAAQGWRSTVLDRQTSPAQETSGNPGGLFHGIVNGQDGTHARFNRAAALCAQREIGHAVRSHGVAGAVQGLLRLDAAEAPAMQALLRRLGLPTDYAQALNADEASALCGITLQQSAWFFPGGGWVDPGGLARAWLAQAAPLAEFRAQVQVASLQRSGDSWQALDASGHVIDAAEVLVLANAGDAFRLLGNPSWPIASVRGQISMIESARAPSLRLPRLPLAGAGYVLPAVNGQAVFGATSQADDADASVRESDHAINLDQLARLTGTRLEAHSLQGRTAWRCVAHDKLPLIGAAPDMGNLLAMQGRLDQARYVPRINGLYVFSALGSRGITWASLGAQTLAAQITGAPSPIEASLLDAIDPARFISRSARRPGARP